MNNHLELRSLVGWTLMLVLITVSPVAGSAQATNGSAASNGSESVAAARANYELASRWTQAKGRKTGVRYFGNPALARIQRSLLVQL